jgi:hypothetical protein
MTLEEPQLWQDGFHSFDGARFPEASDVDRRVVRLVAHRLAAALKLRSAG